MPRGVEPCSPTTCRRRRRTCCTAAQASCGQDTARGCSTAKASNRNSSPGSVRCCWPCSGVYLPGRTAGKSPWCSLWSRWWVSSCRWAPKAPTPLYSLLYRGLFGMAAIRAVPRFSVLALLGIAVLAALAIRSLEARQPRLARGLVVAALLAIAVEYSNGAIAYPPPPSLRTSVGEWLRDQPGSGAVLCVPIRVLAGQHAVHVAVARASPSGRQRLQRHHAAVLRGDGADGKPSARRRCPAGDARHRGRVRGQ